MKKPPPGGTTPLGGGAYLDYCCYGAALALLVLRQATAFASGRARQPCQPVRHSRRHCHLLRAAFRGGLAVAEGTWSSVDRGWPDGPVVYGSAATLSIDGPSERVRVGDGSQAVRFEEALEFPWSAAHWHSSFCIIWKRANGSTRCWTRTSICR